MTQDISALILAAGRSQRMGQAKGRLRLGRLTVLEELISRLDEFVSRIIIVHGAHDYRVPDHPKVTKVKADHWQLGMRASLAEGIAHCGTDWVLLTHVDRPLVARKTIRRLIESKQSAVVIPSHNGRSGHPVLIPPHHLKRLRSTEDLPLNRLIVHRNTHWISVNDPGVVMNLNRPSDFGLGRTVF